MSISTLTWRSLLGAVALGFVLLGSSACGDEYTYFTLSLNLQTTGDKAILQAERKNIDHCTMTIYNDAGETVEGFVLKNGVLPGSGSRFGCAFDETPSFIGLLNYSSLRKSGTLTFELSAGSGEGGQYTEIAKGSGQGKMKPGASVAVEIVATKP